MTVGPATFFAPTLACLPPAFAFNLGLDFALALLPGFPLDFAPALPVLCLAAAFFAAASAWKGSKPRPRAIAAAASSEIVFRRFVCFIQVPGVRASPEVAKAT
jgi:hypothetical protein